MEKISGKKVNQKIPSKIQTNNQPYILFSRVMKLSRRKQKADAAIGLSQANSAPEHLFKEIRASLLYHGCLLGELNDLAAELWNSTDL